MECGWSAHALQGQHDAVNVTSVNRGRGAPSPGETVRIGSTVIGVIASARRGEHMEIIRRSRSAADEFK